MACSYLSTSGFKPDTSSAACWAPNIVVGPRTMGPPGPSITEAAPTREPLNLGTSNVEVRLPRVSDEESEWCDRVDCMDVILVYCLVKLLLAAYMLPVLNEKNILNSLWWLTHIFLLEAVCNNFTDAKLNNICTFSTYSFLSVVKMAIFM